MWMSSSLRLLKYELHYALEAFRRTNKFGVIAKAKEKTGEFCFLVLKNMEPKRQKEKRSHESRRDNKSRKVTSTL